ncbi:MAG: cupredoxin family protein, partial [Xanthobacteraceae bacterium]
HLYFSAGQPGDPKKPARTVTISMREMQFEPSRIEVHKGEQIRFVLRNVGTESHEFVLATPDENRKHEEVMKKFPNMEHDDPNAKRVARSESAELLWAFTKPGEFEFACLIPDHREYGMVGTVVVK